MRLGLTVLPFSLLLALALGAAPATAPTTAQTPEQILAQRKLEEQKEQAQKVLGLPVMPRKKIGELIQFTIEPGDELVIRPRIGRTERSVVPIQGLPGQAVVAIGGDQPNTPEGATFVQFEYSDFSRPDEVFRRTQLFASAASMQISRDVESLAGSSSVSMIQSYGSDDPGTACRLYVQVFAPISDDLQTKLSLTAPSFVELRKRYPREARQYLDPMLRDLQQASVLLAPDAKIANQVFGNESKPDAILTERINAATAKFDADDFKVRQSASKALDELGEPAALALRKADRTGWSIDRSNGVDAFLAKFDSKPPAETNQLKSDPAFLLDCLYSDDPSTRAGALVELGNIVGKPVSLAPDADLTGRAELVDRLYPLLFRPSTQPTTQP